MDIIDYRGLKPDAAWVPPIHVSRPKNDPI
jgi:hypothetical protein